MQKDWKSNAALLASGIVIGIAPGVPLYLDDPEIVTIIETLPPEIVEVVREYRYETKEDMIEKYRELISKVKAGEHLTIGGGELEELYYISASRAFEKGEIVLNDFSGTGQDLVDAVLDAEYNR